MPSDVDPQILWETTKCAIRGFCISFSSTCHGAHTREEQGHADEDVNSNNNL